MLSDMLDESDERIYDEFIHSNGADFTQDWLDVGFHNLFSLIHHLFLA